MARYLEAFEVVREDSYTRALEELARLQRRAENLDDQPQVGMLREIRRLLQVKPLEANASKTPRDVQSKAFHEAERTLPESPVMTQNRVERYLDEVMADPWFRATFPEIKRDQISLSWPRKDGRALGSCRTVNNHHTLRFPPKGRTMNTVLHELAHAVVHARWGQKRVQAHGPEYTYTLLKLVYRRFGRQVGMALQGAYEHGKVKTEPRKPSLKAPAA